MWHKSFTLNEDDFDIIFHEKKIKNKNIKLT